MTAAEYFHISSFGCRRSAGCGDQQEGEGMRERESVAELQMLKLGIGSDMLKSIVQNNYADLTNGQCFSKAPFVL